MDIHQFLMLYLRDEAQIAIAAVNGDILYEGDMLHLRMEQFRQEVIYGNVVKIEGLGSNNAIIITINREKA